MKLIKFKDEQYGVRRFSFMFFKYEYLDLKRPYYWWTTDLELFKQSIGTKERAQECLYMYGDKGKSVLRTRIKNGGRVTLVEFRNGQYGVRRFSFRGLRYKYLDLELPYHWRTSDDKLLGRCISTQEKAQECFNNLQ